MFRHLTGTVYFIRLNIMTLFSIFMLCMVSSFVIHCAYCDTLCLNVITSSAVKTIPAHLLDQTPHASMTLDQRWPCYRDATIPSLDHIWYSQYTDALLQLSSHHCSESAINKVTSIHFHTKLMSPIKWTIANLTSWPLKSSFWKQEIIGKTLNFTMIR